MKVKHSRYRPELAYRVDRGIALPLSGLLLMNYSHIKSHYLHSPQLTNSMIHSTMDQYNIYENDIFPLLQRRKTWWLTSMMEQK
jgi:hypothetical protein